MTASQAEQQFGVDISSRTQLNELQRLEQTHGRKVDEWVDEGMPRQAMGAPAKMRAFRKRKGTPVPWNVEAQNEQSIQRSTEAAADTNPVGDTGVPDSVRKVISSSGQSLDGTIQRKMEDEMGGSFGDVQIHTGPSAANACESINARAFTVGNHVAFNQGEYNPSSPEGQHVIAHELAHVRQQTGGAISMLPQSGLELEVDPDPQLEREAEETAQRVMHGDALGIQRLGKTDVHVQRKQYQAPPTRSGPVLPPINVPGNNQAGPVLPPINVPGNNQAGPALPQTWQQLGQALANGNNQTVPGNLPHALPAEPELEDPLTAYLNVMSPIRTPPTRS